MFWLILSGRIHQRHPSIAREKPFPSVSRLWDSSAPTSQPSLPPLSNSTSQTAVFIPFYHSIHQNLLFPLTYLPLWISFPEWFHCYRFLHSLPPSAFMIIYLFIFCFYISSGLVPFRSFSLSLSLSFSSEGLKWSSFSHLVSEISLFHWPWW